MMKDIGLLVQLVSKKYFVVDLYTTMGYEPRIQALFKKYKQEKGQHELEFIFSCMDTEGYDYVTKLSERVFLFKLRR